MKYCIERIEETNADINSVVCTRFIEALEEAKKVDELLASTTLSAAELRKQKPFLGVPFTSKESTHAAGTSYFNKYSKQGYHKTKLNYIRFQTYLFC